MRFHDAVYVLHAFKKKAKRGVKTPASDLDLIMSRLKDADLDHAERSKEKKRP